MKYILTVFFAFLALVASAQRITIDLPHFAGKEYVWFVCVGDQLDTIARGTLDGKGQTVLTIPPAYKGWQGMSHCLLTEGGGLELILNGEGDFIAGCAVAAPTLEDIYYVGSPENSFLLRRYTEQQRLLNKVSAITATMREYTPQEPLYETLSKEKEVLEKRFAALQRETAASPLYAAQVRQMNDYYNGIGSRLDVTEEEFIEEQRRYVREVLDFGALWNSGLWKFLFATWMSIEAKLGDEVLLADGKAILTRIKDEDIYKTVLKKMTMLFHQYSKEGLLVQMGVDDLLAPGQKAPKLYLPDNTTIVPVNSLVFFYESSCGNCENELLRLRGHYEILQDKSIRVITVSADTDVATYMKNADAFPWQQKLCDYKGVEGVNFKNYEIIGTPMAFLIDKSGIIAGRYAQMSELIEEVNN